MQTCPGTPGTSGANTTKQDPAVGGYPVDQMVEKGAGGDRSKHMVDLEAELRPPAEDRSQRPRQDREETTSGLFIVSHF